ncbi:MAG TPA: histidine triad nucleotide-binding protein [Burkholderiales bacterium]|jgi:histidine triad (HIT) family protein|nr:histidine triad nucleotide-binding protein [Burkholderiales bacterium]
MTSDADCIFCKIVRGDIPAKKVHEDADILAFHDVRPQAPVHLLVIPKTHVPTLYDANMNHLEALGRMLALAGELARKAGAADGFRIIINTGRVGHQEVYHVHMHILGGPEPLGPMLARRK